VHYWRKDYFDALKDGAAAASVSAKWADYSTFCREYERGLRRQAFDVLERFIHSMERESFAERRRFVSWLMSFAHERNAIHILIPQPLKIRVVEPTLAEWTIVEPTCAEPHRWIGGYEHLQLAIELDPADQIALRAFVIFILRQVDYATHELPSGYLGSPWKDLENLDRIEVLLLQISNESDRAAYAVEVAEQNALIQEYLRKRSEPLGE
jgi:hypothetical protein